MTTIGMHIKPIRFLKFGAPKVIFDIDGKILERLIIIEEIYTKLIFNRYISLNWGDYCKFEAAYTINYKNNMIEAKKKNFKTKAK